MKGKLASCVRGVALLVATGGFAGYAPVAPGTIGSIIGLPLAWVLWWVPSPAVRLLTVVALLLVGIPICGSAAQQLGGEKDPSAVIYDEIAVMPVVLFGIEMSNPWAVLSGFVLFRVFDVLKPPPCRWLEQLPQGSGILADDLMAALYARAVLQLIVWAGLFGQQAA